MCKCVGQRLWSLVINIQSGWEGGVRGFNEGDRPQKHRQRRKEGCRQSDSTQETKNFFNLRDRTHYNHCIKGNAEGPTSLSFNLSMFHSCVLPFNPTNLAAVVSEKQTRRGKKKKTETQTREEYWQKQARQWHRAAHRTMLPFKESLVSDQTRRPLDSLTYYALKIVPITPPTCRH